jgi:hypothetical protein
MERKGTRIQNEKRGHSQSMYSALFLLFIFTVILSPVFGEEVNKGDDNSVKAGHAVLRDKWGIEILRLKITAAGHILDLRYRVIDPVKSFPVFDTKIKPVLIDEQSGRDLSIYTAPRIGGMRQKSRRPESGRVYFILFSNPAGLVKEGDKVTLRIEDVKVEHIRVEDGGSSVDKKDNPGG